MKYIKRNDEGVWQLDRYFIYLEEVKNKIPKDIYPLVCDERKYMLSYPESLHDAWLESLKIFESPIQNNSTRRCIDIILQLLGPYHDRKFTITYEKVNQYTNVMDKSISLKDGHGNLIIHEFMFFDNRNLVHELVFDTGIRFIINCEKIKFSETLTKTPCNQPSRSD